MDSGRLKISRIPIKVFYDKVAAKSIKKLPSEQRNIDIIRGITFGELLQHIKEKDKKKINSWLKQHENKLKSHLSMMQNDLMKEKYEIYCTNLNYILDFVVQALKNFNNSNEFFNLIHVFEEKSRDVLQSYTTLNCLRNFHNSNDKNLYIKKIMYDLCEDIQYMSWFDQNIERKHCSKMVNRIKNRWKILTEIYDAVSDKKSFDFDKECTLSTMNQMLKTLKCNATPKAPPTVTVTERQTLTALPGSGGDLSETRRSEDVEDPIDVENPESVDTFPEDLTIGLPVNDDPPKLDTTYAAASLAGVSLFGTIIYKYGPFRNRLNPRRGARIGSNIFPLDNNLYDGALINNFEYLQTGIPNDEYQLGYGSVTDY
ncbi:VIR protein [Plasmodium vivax]|uniref:VIR protein n=1 Tax=Plasmodium vivax TaxID=5855 RepID=A0A1G4GU75_PLAVI|nr:VIR protein [Plasmodium vivax]